jgi:hypothetical protein
MLTSSFIELISLKAVLNKKLMDGHLSALVRMTVEGFRRSLTYSKLYWILSWYSVFRGQDSLWPQVIACQCCLSYYSNVRVDCLLNVACVSGLN